MKTTTATALALILLATPAFGAFAQVQPATMPATAPAPATAPIPTPPKEWIDKETGHRVVRISEEAGSSSNYFNVNSYTPDGKWMAYSSPSGIMALDLKTFKSKLIVPGRVSLSFVGNKSGAVYYTTGIVQTQGHDAQSPNTPGAVPQARDRMRDGPRVMMAYDIDTGKSREVAKLDPGYSIATINADETLFAGSRETLPRDPNAPSRGPNGGGTNDPASELLPDGRKATYAEGREIQINRRLVQNIPMEIFTINIETGEKRTITASTDWLNHLQFSPTDPNLLLYCHEGNWHIVDRMWLVNVKSGEKPIPLHERTMNMEIAGHEWWSADGKTVWYDLQTPRGEVFWVAGYTVATGKRTQYHIDRNSWGVHFNSSHDGSVFSSDGGDPEMAAHAPDGKYIYLLRPRDIPDVAGIHAANSGDLIKPGELDPEKLVNMNPHNYRSEPNASFTPDGKWLIFRSNLWGPGHVYAVEVSKANP